jgi:hypothetical protein
MQVRAYCHFLDFIAHFSKERKNSKSEKRLEEDVLSLSSLSLSFSLSFSLSLSLSLSLALSFRSLIYCFLRFQPPLCDRAQYILSFRREIPPCNRFIGEE